MKVRSLNCQRSISECSDVDTGTITAIYLNWSCQLCI
nr:MAG TPA: hypothetical protein [Inoviridae sp.]